ncbi:DUF2333 family protein [Psychrosphaera haliotis]|uniref:DUF2333 family protein n=1 Tax=Psychrosphaera haliotis TaxID=555083 RepID=A0A6N8F9F0_9GAMM|nr:DUF2333 family protein [Psychrosphaera haliotis]MUH72888.1 DUF2333 family protein [Psychrosphaera haliotis]
MKKWLMAGLGAIVVISIVLAQYWSFMPDVFSVEERSLAKAKALNTTPVTGFTTTHTLIEVTNVLLNKPGGYLSNDITPPSLFLDNIPAFEFGALEMSRDLALALRRDFSRSQSQSVENPYLKVAQPQFSIDHTSWALPSAESSYTMAVEALEKYRDSLSDKQQGSAQFYARADNLKDWLNEVEKRMGSLSQRLSASVGQDRINIDLAGETGAIQSTQTAKSQMVQTSWWKIDDVFYEAKGASWALLHFLKAVEIDFASTLQKKNAQTSLKQIIRELEATQHTIWSPMVLNGSGFGVLANHSLVMANYISRANAAIIDLKTLLTQG